MFCGSNDVTKIIQYLDLNKAHGDDVICISMLKICGESVSKTLDIVFKSCIKKVPIYKTRKATGFKSLLLICWEINQVTSKFQIKCLDKTCKQNSLKQKKWISLSNLPYSKSFRNQIST